MRFLLRLLINAAALWVAVRLVHGITYDGSGWLPFFGVALVFGVVNAFLRPVLKLLSLPLLPDPRPLRAGRERRDALADGRPLGGSGTRFPRRRLLDRHPRGADRVPGQRPPVGLPRRSPGGGKPRPYEAGGSRPASSVRRRRRSASSGRSASGASRQSQLSSRRRGGSCAPRCRGRGRPARDDRACSRRRCRRADQRPLDRLTVDAEVLLGALPLLLAEALEPAARGIVVVRAGVDDARARTDGAGAGCSPRRRRTAGSSSPVPQARRSVCTSSVMKPRSSATSGSSPSATRASKSSFPGPGIQRPFSAVSSEAGTDQ